MEVRLQEQEIRAYVTQHIKYFKFCYSSHLLGARTVWILGSSIVKHVFATLDNSSLVPDHYYHPPL